MSQQVGDINAWRCEDCGRLTVGLHVDAGVTPYMLACRATPGCTGMGRSLMYPPASSWFPAPPAPHVEWYRPDAKQLRRMSPGMQDHVRRGGLALRELDQARAAGHTGASFFRSGGAA